MELPIGAIVAAAEQLIGVRDRRGHRVRDRMHRWRRAPRRVFALFGRPRLSLALVSSLTAQRLDFLRFESEGR